MVVKNSLSFSGGNIRQQQGFPLSLLGRDQVAYARCHNRINMTGAAGPSQSAINRAENQLRLQTYGRNRSGLGQYTHTHA